LPSLLAPPLLRRQFPTLPLPLPLPACLPAGRPVSISRQAALASDFQAPPDRASEVLIQRVKQFIDNPPGEDWDGVDKVKSKAG
jgi:hypothetical protein